MEIINWAQLSASEQDAALERPAHGTQDKVHAIVTDIIANVRARGDEALREYAHKLDHCPDDELQLSSEEI